MALNLSVITCTGDRSEAFNLCTKWLQNQTIEPYQWVLINDGQTPFGYAYVPNTDFYHLPYSPTNTLRRNLEFALSKTQGDGICFFEDDDFYVPDYLEEIKSALEKVPMAGVFCINYYNVSQKAQRNLRNYTYSTLAATAFRADLIPLFLKSFETPYKTNDIAFWRMARKENIPHVLLNPKLHVGVKGMPGRKGIGIGHRECKVPIWHFDTPDLTIAKGLFGDDFKYYEPFILGHK